ncbi:RDD family protein [Metasolibacillus meyeri]|uniref:RDD family protein n=1 Tax=Metasolibacillus meyeri TaxID=1071052 RepID=A0AAW9NWK8_9BACL|nr:RDD family protein [Metasolibacillus meyeri]MEC1180380.1 RDD family protein [Metasolibacillus meyeri]
MEYVQTVIPPTTQYVQKTAGFWVRLWAFIIDGIIISAAIGIIINPIFYFMDWSLMKMPWYAPLAIISTIVYFSYFAIMTRFWQQTVGKMIFGLRVVKTDGQRLDWSTVLFREVIGRFISNKIFYLPYLAVAFSPKNQGLLDYIADTIVVHEGIYTEQQIQPTAPVQRHEIEYMI